MACFKRCLQKLEFTSLSHVSNIMNFLDCSFQNSKLTQGNIHASRIENLPVMCTAIFIWVIAGLSRFILCWCMFYDHNNFNTVVCIFSLYFIPYHVL